MRRLLLILATLAALPLSAATRYALAIDEAGRIRSHLDATVLAEGKQHRIDVVPPFAFDVLLSDDGGASSIALATGGQPEKCVITATVSDVRTVAAPPHAFDRPPLLGAPGKN